MNIYVKKKFLLQYFLNYLISSVLSLSYISEFREKMSPDYVTLILWFVDRPSNSETKTPNFLKIEPGLM